MSGTNTIAYFIAFSLAAVFHIPIAGIRLLF